MNPGADGRELVRRLHDRGSPADAELRTLLSDLSAASFEIGLSDGAIEVMLGVPPGGLDMDAARRELTRGAEGQLRRLLEVLHLAGMMFGQSGVSRWLDTHEDRLGHATPLRAMQRPGGISLVRDLLRMDWERIVEGACDRDTDQRPPKV